MSFKCWRCWRLGPRHMNLETQLNPQQQSSPKSCGMGAAGPCAAGAGGPGSLCASVSPRQLPPVKVSSSGLRSDSTIWETRFWMEVRFLAAVIIHFCPGDWISSEDNLIWGRHLSAAARPSRVIAGPYRVPSLGSVDWWGLGAWHRHLGPEGQRDVMLPLPPRARGPEPCSPACKRPWP